MNQAAELFLTAILSCVSASWFMQVCFSVSLYLSACGCVCLAPSLFLVLCVCVRERSEMGEDVFLECLQA